MFLASCCSWGGASDVLLAGLSRGGGREVVLDLISPTASFAYRRGESLSGECVQAKAVGG